MLHASPEQLLQNLRERTVEEARPDAAPQAAEQDMDFQHAIRQAPAQRTERQAPSSAFDGLKIIADELEATRNILTEEELSALLGDNEE
jgi:hypothetical protein